MGFLHDASRVILNACTIGGIYLTEAPTWYKSHLLFGCKSHRRLTKGATFHTSDSFQTFKRISGVIISTRGGLQCLQWCKSL